MARLACAVLGAFLLAPLVGGCSPYLEDYHFAPRPAYADIPPTPPQTVAPVTASASVIGVRRADRDAGIPLSVEVRLRVDNSGPQSVTFDPLTLELTSASLLRFPPPLLRPPPQGPVTLAPNDAAYVDAYFPFPPGYSPDNTDLESLRLRWNVTLDGHAVAQAVDFRRVHPAYYYYPPPYYYGPYWGYPYPYPYVGGVVVIRHRF